MMTRALNRFYTTEMKRLFLALAILVFTSPGYAYMTQGVQNIRNINKTLKSASKAGLDIPAKEKAIKKQITKLKKKNKKEFEEKLASKIENPSFYQGYLEEVNVGLNKTEKAKQLAKWVLLQQIEKDWKILETTIFNKYDANSLKQYKAKLLEQLNGAVFVPSKKGLSFEVADWGIALVLPTQTTIRWKIQFNSRYDNNELEEGADKIKIEPSDKPSLGLDLEENQSY